MAKKIALLIGVGSYGEGLASLQCPANGVEAMRSILESPDVGDFDQVITLLDPNVSEMRRQIGAIYGELTKQDLVLLYFTGHGVKDTYGSFYLTTAESYLFKDGDINPGTAVEAEFITGAISRCYAQRKVVILDCCFAAAFAKGFIGMDDGSVDIATQLSTKELGEKGCCVLTSSTSTKYALEQEGESLSVYTRYLIEGLRTGGAALDGEAFISARHLHDYVRAKVKVAAPAMKPAIFNALEGEGIAIAKAYLNGEQRYRKRVQEKVERAKGRLSPTARANLEHLRTRLQVSVEQAAVIHSEVLQPYEEKAKNLKRYETTLAEEIEYFSPLSLEATRELEELKQRLNLRNEDVQLLEKKLAGGIVSADTFLANVSNVAIVPSAGKQAENTLILLDPNIARQWHRRLEDVQVYRKKTLADIDISKKESYQQQWQNVRCITPSDLFLPDLSFTDHHSEAIPGGLSPQKNTVLEFEFAGEPITPLIPIQPLLLDYFTPEDLIERIEFQVVDGNHNQVEVSLDLPLSGLGESPEPSRYRITRIYSLKPEKALSVIPVLELWPNFVAAGWKSYYAFYFDLAAEDLTFHISLPEAIEKHDFQDDQGGRYSIAKLEKFPTYIECIDETENLIGLIFPIQPPEIRPNQKWTVGVDYDAESTNIYINHRFAVRQFPLNEELLLNVTESMVDTRFPALFNYFFIERFLPIEKPLPIYNCVTTRGGNRPIEERTRVILDGRIYCPSIRDFDPNEEWIETDLNHSPQAKRLFFSHLILQISAIAIKQGVKEINWAISYSSTLSRNEYDSYVEMWLELLDESAHLTGLRHRCSSNTKEQHFQPRSLAAAQKFAFDEYIDRIHFACINIGDAASDISIWQDQKLVHQCSIPISSTDLLDSFLALSPEFVAEHFNRSFTSWKALSSSDFSYALSTLLRWESESWLKTTRPKLTDREDMQGLSRLIAIGYGGLYYYLRLIVTSLVERGVYKPEQPLSIYLGGKGAGSLDWIDMTGNFTPHSEINVLLSRVLDLGKDSTTYRSWRSALGNEVARGLVLSTTKLEKATRPMRNSFVPGEAYTLNNSAYSWNQPMTFEEDIDNFGIPSFDNLSVFLYKFHEALAQERIEEFGPLPGYSTSVEMSENAELWEGTRRALREILQENSLISGEKNVKLQPPFILGLKALLRYLSKQWAGKI